MPPHPTGKFSILGLLRSFLVHFRGKMNNEYLYLHQKMDWLKPNQLDWLLRLCRKAKKLQYGRYRTDTCYVAFIKYIYVGTCMYRSFFNDIHYICTCNHGIEAHAHALAMYSMFQKKLVIASKFSAVEMPCVVKSPPERHLHADLRC